jgi:hypothetical protein
MKDDCKKRPIPWYLLFVSSQLWLVDIFRQLVCFLFATEVVCYMRAFVCSFRFQSRRRLYRLRVAERVW